MFNRDPTTASRGKHIVDEPPPRINVRYFYASQLQLDDPLAAVPPPTTSTSAPVIQAPKPFSAYDSAALDDAWNKLRTNIKTYELEVEKEHRKKRSETTPLSSPRWRPRGDSMMASSPRDRSARGSHGASRKDTLKFSALHVKEDSKRFESDTPRERANAAEQEPLGSLTKANDSIGAFDIGQTEQGTTGRPFARAPARSNRLSGSWDDKTLEDGRRSASRSLNTSPRRTSIRDERPQSQNVSPPPMTKVPVGYARLHQVAMPSLKLEPLYWMPVNDVAEVIRATWFYKDTLLPVEVDVANLLEAGYVRLKPWTQTWKDELDSAVAVGAMGEERIAHLLWPKVPAKKVSSRPGTSTSAIAKEDEDSPEAVRARTLAIATGTITGSSITDYDNRAAGVHTYGNDGRLRSYKQSRILYANETEAFILRPSLQPSAYYGRRPLANYIRKEHKIGIRVVRGFDQGAWDALHPNESSVKGHLTGNDVRRTSPRQLRPTGSTSTIGQGLSEPTRVTDLILVIHGIGQKLSERMESYHFTTAMNTFRRETNIQLGDPAVKSTLRQGMGGIMVLPVNWRSTLSFEDGGYRDGPDESTENQFTLKDITPESLPHVRNIISDVMLDIPYYLSHHQPRMISAVIREANRIHGLWCKNNPGFDKYGRVHLLAHSLGSVMAIDILSKQPTRVESSNMTVDDSNPSHFSFNTVNYYQCGSPAGFFLLLRKADLRPRKGRETSSASAADVAIGVAGEEGEYGCIAVENIYNIVNPYDPVAYRMNATIDAAYASSLRPAIVPTASSSWFSFGSPSRSAYSRTAATAVATSSRPNIAQRLPSTVELETHDFSREEVAEKRAFLLNDNGQVDYFLRYGGGALEIQYLTMLGAHSSYWISKDFIRFLVVETGREPGRAGALEGLRPVKKKGLM